MKAELHTHQLEKQLADWKSYGAVSTPEEIVKLIIKLAGFKKVEGLDILEPACGFCNFLQQIHADHPHNRFYGVEINEEVFGQISKTYSKTHKRFQLVKEDFLLWETEKKFDLVIGNPPYGIIGAKEHYAINVLKDKKGLYKKIITTWHGKYNIYGAFIEKGVKFLKPHGKLAFIIPATWMILDDFQLLRKYLANFGKVIIYYLGKNVFKGISVSSCILIFEKGSSGLDLHLKENGNLPLVYSNSQWTGELIRFATPFTESFETNRARLADLFDIKISARSPEVKSFKPLLEKPSKSALPFMNGRNVQKGVIERKAYIDLWLEENSITELKAFYGVLPRIVVGHTKGGIVVSALEDQLYPYIGDVYHLLPKVGFSKNQLLGIVNWLNSKELETYTKTLYRDISPHTTATQLKILPLNIQANGGTLFQNI